MNSLTQNRGEAGAVATEAQEAAPAWENPLIPNKKLRALYKAMVELRLLEAHLGLPYFASHPLSSSAANLALSSFAESGGSASRPSNRRSRPQTPSGEEGCRASTILCLNPGDLTSDPGQGFSTAFLRGTKLPDLLSHARDAKSRRPTSGTVFPGQLPALPDTADRLHIALGAALALKPIRAASRSSSALVAAYLYAADLNPKQWTTLLAFASANTLPLLLFVLPNRQKTKGLAAPGHLSHLSGKWGVPGIPVDADDPVALYRVTQESTLRIRAGGGAVLMECIPFHLAGKKADAADPIVTMQQFMLHRRIVTETWLRTIEISFAARIKTVTS